MMKNKRAWIRIIEAFVAILLVSGALLVLLDKSYIGREDISEKVYDAELSILRDVELDKDLRGEILAIDNLNIPVMWDDAQFPMDVKDRINERIPNYLECEAKICDILDLCEPDDSLSENIYVQSVGITANLTIYNPRQLKLFCWVA